MRIQYNQGLFTQNRYNHTNPELNKTLNKLSSGYKINSASDDAAGLSISEKMRGQIRGLNQASKNIQDGLSLINTTEAGLGQIQNPNLARMRELIIQAANDKNTPEDHQKIQLEIEALKRGINDIANGTEFNTVKTLIPEDLKVKDTVSASKFDIVFLIDDSGTMGSDIGMVTQGLSTFSEKMNTYGDVHIASTSIVHPNRDLAATNDIEEVKNHLKTTHVASGGSTNPDQILLNLLNGGPNNLNLRSDSHKVYIILTDTYPESNNLDNLTIKNVMDATNAQVYVLGINNHGSNDINYFNSHYGEFATDIFVPKSSSDISENLTPNLADEIIKNTNLEHLLQKDIIIHTGANTGQQIIIPYMITVRKLSALIV